MRRQYLLIGIFAAMAHTASAQSLLFKLDLNVNPVSRTSFEVIEARGAGAMDIWCAAAEYAEDTLGARGNERLYVASPRGAAQTEQGRKGVVFTTEGSTQRSMVSVSVKRAGESLPIHHARQFCLNHILEPADRF